MNVAAAWMDTHTPVRMLHSRYGCPWPAEGYVPARLTNLPVNACQLDSRRRASLSSKQVSSPARHSFARFPLTGLVEA